MVTRNNRPDSAFQLLCHLHLQSNKPLVIEYLQKYNIRRMVRMRWIGHKKEVENPPVIIVNNYILIVKGLGSEYFKKFFFSFFFFLYVTGNKAHFRQPISGLVGLVREPDF